MMILFVLSIFVLALSIILLIAFRDPKPLPLIILSLFAMFFTCTTSVPTGHTGIVTTFGRVEDMTYEAGFHFKKPWHEIINMDNREQRTEFDLQAFSADIQNVNVRGSVNFAINKVDAAALYRNVGKGYAPTLIQPRIQEDTKAVFSRYAAEDLIVNRNDLSDEICDLLRNDLGAHGLNIISVAIEDIDFSDAFTDAVEAKQVAAQNKLRSQTEQEQMTMVAKAEAQRKVVEAEAQSNVVKIEADAQAYAISVKASAEADANQQIADSLTQELIAYTAAQGWDGKLPSTYVDGGDALPLIQTQTGANDGN